MRSLLPIRALTPTVTERRARTVLANARLNDANRQDCPSRLVTSQCGGGFDAEPTLNREGPWPDLQYRRGSYLGPDVVNQPRTQPRRHRRSHPRPGLNWFTPTCPPSNISPPSRCQQQTARHSRAGPLTDRPGCASHGEYRPQGAREMSCARCSRLAAEKDVLIIEQAVPTLLALVEVTCIIQ